jgi:prophage maintenance system killer protein
MLILQYYTYNIVKLDITLEEITGINQALGGTVVSTASIEFALEAGQGKSIYHRIALLWRAILLDQPFSGRNKRTAFNATTLILKRNGVRVGVGEKERLVEAILKVSKKSESSLRRIERRIRYAIERN